MAGVQSEVAVVGAGLSGLSAARRLRDAGFDVRVVEARDRVGGRTLSQTLASDVIDLGGQWIGPTQNRVAALASELGIATFEQYSQGKKLVELGSKLRTYSGLVPSVGALSLADAAVGILRVDRLARKVPVYRPRTAEQAARWDHMTAEDWISSTLRTERGRALFRIATQMVFAAEPSELSFLYFLFYLRSGGGFQRLVSVRGGAQQERLAGGAQQLSVRLAEQLGERVMLSSPVEEIHQDTEGVTLLAQFGEVTARFAVLALAPRLARSIRFIPELPPKRVRLQNDMQMGSVVKCVIAYDRAFWRDAGLSGEAISDGPVVRATFDDTSHDGSQPALVAFVVGEAARRFGAIELRERQALVIDDLARLFGERARRPLAYVDKDWVIDPWSAGCYVGIAPPGLLSAAGDALRDPVGPIHFAGTETASRWAGYLDGAIEAGERAADEVIARVRFPRG